MRDRDFEKSFQRKANELRIQPSPELWERVAAQIQEKDRKRGFAWIWLAAAMIAGGLALWFIGPTIMNENGSGQQMAEKNLNTLESNPESTGAASANVNPASTNPAAAHPAAVNPAASNPAEANPAKANSAAGQSAAARAATSPLATQPATDKKLNAVKDQPISNQREQPVQRGSGRLSASSGYIAKNNNDHTHAGQIQDPKAGVEVDGEIEEPVLNSKFSTLALHKPPTAEISFAGAEQGDTKLDASLLDNIPTIKEKQKDGWHLGMLAGGGTGSLREGLATSYQTPSETFTTGSLIAGPPVPNAAPEPTPSSVKAGPAFQVGIGISRPISRRLNFNTGLQYAYSSSRIEVGQKIDQNTANANFRLQSVAGTEAYVGVGNNGRAYYNAYHYAQLPLELGWVLDNRNRLSWNNGVVLGYLISTDALHYNSLAGAYYKDNSLVNKWQTNLQTSFQYLVFPTPQWNLSVGPYASYQLRNIDKTPGDKRLLSFGLNARIVFNNSK
ncbi:MAG TPA: outer membrane beta-barrel protein [Flavihumibacter sp.]